MKDQFLFNPMNNSRQSHYSRFSSSFSFRNIWEIYFSPRCTGNLSVLFLHSRLSGVSLEAADRFSTGQKYASAVEVCHCPPGYSGTSCEVSIYCALTNMPPME